MSLNHGKQSAVDFAERVRGNQRKLRYGLKSQYDFIVCGSGSSGSVLRAAWPKIPTSACSCSKQAAATRCQA